MQFEVLGNIILYMKYVAFIKNLHSKQSQLLFLHNDIYHINIYGYINIKIYMYTYIEELIFLGKISRMFKPIDVTHAV